MAKNGNESTSKRSPRVTKHLESRMGTKFKVDDDPKRPKSLSSLVDELYHKHSLTQKGGRFADMVDPKPSMKEKIRILLKGPLRALKEDVSLNYLTDFAAKLEAGMKKSKMPFRHETKAASASKKFLLL